MTSGHRTRWGDTNWLASITALLQFFYRSHFKAIKVTVIPKCSTQLQRGFNFMVPSSLHFPKLKVENGREKKKKGCFLWSQSIQFFYLTTTSGCGQWWPWRHNGWPRTGLASALLKPTNQEEKQANTHTDMGNQSYASGNGANWVCNRETGPCMFGGGRETADGGKKKRNWVKRK